MCITNKEIKEALEKVLAGEVHNKNYGICNALYMCLKHPHFNVTEWVGTHAQTWEHYSGDREYPIPSTEGLTPERSYLTSDNLWHGEQGELRESLLKHLIQECTT